MSLFNKRITFAHVPQIVAILIIVNGLYYVLASLIFFIDLPVLHETLDVVQQINILDHENFTAGFSILFGLMTILVGIGLYKRSRIAWVWTLVFLFLLLALNFMSGTYNKMFYVSMALFIILIFSKNKFNHSIGFFASGQSIAAVSIIFAMAYGVVGSYLLKGEFTGISSWTDAIYFTIVTYSTVGYGDISPKSDVAHLFTVSMILIGISSFATAIALYFGPFLEKRMRELFSVFTKLDHVKGHYIICGNNAISVYLIKAFKNKEISCVIIDPNLDLSEATNSKYVTYIKGDPTDATVLNSCSINESIGVISTVLNDAENILIALTCKSIRKNKGNENFRIIVSISKEENIKNAKLVGVDEVMSPAKIYSDILINKIMN